MEILQNAPPLKTPAVTYALAAKFPCYAFNGARVKAQSCRNFCQRQNGIWGVHCLQTFRVWLTDARQPLGAKHPTDGDSVCFAFHYFLPIAVFIRSFLRRNG